jgi:glycosyltransferase involved in cell wall biosynthesis
VKVLVDAYQEANPSSGQSELHIYGDLQQWPGYSRKLIQNTKKRSDVFWEGPFQSAKLPEVLSDLDVIVVPSIWFENRPTVILEAFAHGIPVIASNLGGMAEMVENGASGLLFEAGNSHDLSVQLKAVIDQPAILETLKNGIQTVKTSLEENEQIEKLYAQLVMKNSVPVISG